MKNPWQLEMLFQLSPAICELETKWGRFCIRNRGGELDMWRVNEPVYGPMIRPVLPAYGPVRRPLEPRPNFPRPKK